MTTQTQTGAKLPLLLEATLYSVVFTLVFALLNQWVILPISVALHLPPYQKVSPGNVHFSLSPSDFVMLALGGIALVVLVRFLGAMGTLANIFAQRAATLVLLLYCISFASGLLLTAAALFVGPKVAPFVVYSVYGLNALFVFGAGCVAGLLTKLTPREAIKVAAVPLLLGLLFSTLTWLAIPSQREHFAELVQQLWPRVYLPIPLTLLGVYVGSNLRKSNQRNASPVEPV